MATLLVIEDEEVLAKNVRRALQKLDHVVHLAATAAEGERLFAELSPDLTLLDLRLPDGSGLEVLERLRAQRPGANVLMMTAHATVEDAVKAIQLGARDYLQKPLHMDDLRHAVARALEESQLKQEVQYYRSRESRGSALESIVGESPGIRELRGRVQRLCNLPSGASAPTVLVTGETGTGKGLVARVLHYNGARADRPFLSVNCAAIPENLVESELFGHERGAFTDARTARPGLFQAADKGTLFLDEIGCVPPAIQVKILKALEEKSVRPIGGRAERTVDIQVVAATNSDLEKQVAEGSFREDLYFRLRVAVLSVPPLRERSEDALLLADRFLGELAAGYRLPGRSLESGARDAILAYRWPGNVRELRNTLDRALLFGEGDTIGAEALGLPAQAGGGVLQLGGGHGRIEVRIPDQGVSFDEVERALLEGAMRKAGGNQSQAARLLRMSRDTLRYRLEKFGIAAAGAADDAP
jgi:DNA-binding NtrC family response regulator